MGTTTQGHSLGMCPMGMASTSGLMGVCTRVNGGEGKQQEKGGFHGLQVQLMRVNLRVEEWRGMVHLLGMKGIHIGECG